MRGRSKGFKLTDEQKENMKEGRKKAQEAKIANGEPPRKSRKVELESYSKPKLYITGNEKDALDYFPAIRESLRPLHRNRQCGSLCNEIAKSPQWSNVRATLNRLEAVFDIVENTSTKVKVKRTRKPMTEVQRLAASERLAVARSMRKKNG
jgi:hypothetical protein